MLLQLLLWLRINSRTFWFYCRSRQFKIMFRKCFRFLFLAVMIWRSTFISVILRKEIACCVLSVFAYLRKLSELNIIVSRLLLIAGRVRIQCILAVWRHMICVMMEIGWCIVAGLSLSIHIIRLLRGIGVHIDRI